MTEAARNHHAKAGRAWTTAVVLLVLFAVLVPLAPGIPIPSLGGGADANFHLQLLGSYIDSLHAGALFPRWLPESNLSLGSPVFYFYGRLPYLLAAVLAIPLHLSPASALRGGMAAFHLLAFFTCRAWLRTRYSRRAADCGALLFAVAPFAALLEPVFRSGYAEIAAASLLPLLFLLLDRATNNAPAEAREVALLGLVYALLAATHLPQTLLAIGVASAYAWLMHGGSRVLRNVAAAGSGLLLSAPNLLPALALERTITPEGWQCARWADVRNNFLFSSQRFHTYFFSAQEFYLYGTWLLCFAVLALSFADRYFRQQASTRTARHMLLLLAALLAAMTRVFSLLWTHTLLGSLQFPWRLFPLTLAITASVISLLIEDSQRLERQLLCLLAILVVCEAAVPFEGFLLSERRNRKQLENPPAMAALFPRYAPPGMRELPFYSRKRSFVPEYLPASASAAGWHLSPDERLLVPPAGVPSTPALPGSTMTEAREADGSLTLHGSVDAPTSVLLPTFYFPDIVLSGAAPATLALDPPSGLARVFLPAGAVAVRVAHTGTLPIVVGADRLGLLGALWIAGLLLYSRRSHPTARRAARCGKDVPRLA